MPPTKSAIQKALNYFLHVLEYRLIFDIDFTNLEYECLEDIVLERPDSVVELDCLGLEIRNVEESGRNCEFLYNPEKAKLRIQRANSGKKSNEKVTISIAFSGKIATQSLHGLFKSSYGTGYLVSTDLEPNGARRVFPCVDHPAYKAVFKLEVIADGGLRVIANTPLANSAILTQVGSQGERKRFVFTPTPRMSTYLFFLALGKFEEIAKSATNVEYVVATPPGEAERGTFALEHAPMILQAFEEYFSIKYPLPKLHLLAIPEYPSGAMENWGAITFREVALLVDKNTSETNKRRVALVIAHEIAHQWFGDLVTMNWWNDLWLNESFATFMEQMVIDKLYPQWDTWSDFLIEQTSDALNGDSFLTTHPIDVKVDSPDEISQIFDEISYGKGGSILRMIEAFVGKEAFRKGVSSYLKEHSFGNAEGSNLWQHIGQASHQPVKEIMQAWIRKAGYPLVKASLHGDELQLEQHRFLQTGEQTEETLWPIPITASINGKELSPFVFNGTTQKLKLDNTEGPVNLKLNLAQAGFYRVYYDDQLFARIRASFVTLNRFDKWGIVEDLFAFLKAEWISPRIYFDFLAQLNEEKEYIIVSSVADQLRYLRLIARESREVRSAFTAFNDSQISRLGLDPKRNEPDTAKILRGKLALNLAEEGSNETARELADQFGRYSKLDPNIRSAVAVAYAKRQTPKEAYDSIHGTMQRMKNEGDLIRLFGGLVAIPNPVFVEKALDLSLSGEFNRADSAYSIPYAASNRAAGEAVWKWVRANIPRIKETFSGTYILTSILKDVIPLVGLGREEEVKEYFQRHPLRIADSGIRKGLELLRINSALEKRLNQT